MCLHHNIDPDLKLQINCREIMYRIYCSDTSEAILQTFSVGWSKEYDFALAVFTRLWRQIVAM